ncbi:pyridoxamine 5'-phosphate oxidase family protein [Sporolactobacillus shoreicorticis]|uniref:Pyridoxamine 5'-phosphate oxidase family protein n=1 Tax=Sporolactobacillus shoreicorticis TaxID=1923877 RepID=A0ABW5S1J9_9BACL|nr:pyridoxamine 5'-phosphate oxidase family protein [Sporolactobacillus shoreicorticis]MCO7124611.1 pyridoxamine 5'-phosphate oxidase family protein [Sporolactobacillus shoreicorticis]
MYREMRRKNKKLSEEEMLQILNTGLYGVLSTVGEDGIPYGVPISFVYKEDQLYFHSALVGHKLDNIKANNHVSFCVVNDVETVPNKFTAKFKSVIAFGTAEEVIDNEKKAALLKLFLEKYSNDFIESGVNYIERAINAVKIVQVNIDHMTAKGGK